MNHLLKLLTALVLIACTPGPVVAQTSVERMLENPDAWFTSDEGRTTVRNIVSWQNANGGWYKGYDVGKNRADATPSTRGGQPGDGPEQWNAVSTFDNGATNSEIRLLARAHSLTGDSTLIEPIRRGLEYIFKAQYDNGGWPQRYPLQNNYGRHITYNDDAMLDVMNLLQDVADRKPDFAFLDDSIRERAASAVERGIECILNTQVRIDGRLTVWGQQHDEVTLAPASARSYELPSLCSTESASIVQFLMSLPNPSDRVREAVHAAVAWFEEHKITGLRVEREYDPKYASGYEMKLTPDPDARPTWARFYDLVEQKPMFVDRDGVMKRSIFDIGHERRTKYAWYNGRGNGVLERYAQWKLEHGQ